MKSAYLRVKALLGCRKTDPSIKTSTDAVVRVTQTVCVALTFSIIAASHPLGLGKWRLNHPFSLIAKVPIEIKNGISFDIKFNIHICR